ncbi:MAG: hypothetical protein ACRD50_10205 [Candidatus Acidiferrales bacterium]
MSLACCGHAPRRARLRVARLRSVALTRSLAHVAFAPAQRQGFYGGPARSPCALGTGRLAQARLPALPAHSLCPRAVHLFLALRGHRPQGAVARRCLARYALKICVGVSLAPSLVGALFRYGPRLAPARPGLRSSGPSFRSLIAPFSGRAGALARRREKSKSKASDTAAHRRGLRVGAVSPIHPTTARAALANPANAARALNTTPCALAS